MSAWVIRRVLPHPGPLQLREGESQPALDESSQPASFQSKQRRTFSFLLSTFQSPPYRATSWSWSRDPPWGLGRNLPNGPASVFAMVMLEAHFKTNTVLDTKLRPE